MIPLHDFWNHLTYRPGLTGLMEDWVKCLGETGWVALRRELFLKGDTATSYRRPTDGHEFHIRKIADGSYAFISAISGAVERQGLTEQDVLNFRVDVGALRDRVAQALGIKPDPARVISGARAAPIGMWAPEPGIVIPAFLLLPPTRNIAQQEITRLIMQNPRGFLLFVPVALRIEADLQRAVRDQNASILVLNELVCGDDHGRLVASAAWTIEQEAYRRRLKRSVDSNGSMNRFANLGHWMLRFDGGPEICLSDELQGAIYIQYLLQRPRQRTHVVRMMLELSNEAPRERAVTDALVKGAERDAGPLIDLEAMPRLRAASDQWLDELEQANAQDDAARIAEAQRNIDGIAVEVAAAMGFGGRQRRSGDVVDRLRKRVSATIRRVVEKIRERDGRFAAHLDGSLTLGRDMCYEPDRVIDWRWE